MPGKEDAKKNKHNLNRRSFIKTGLTGGLAMTSIGTLTGTTDKGDPSVSSEDVSPSELDELSIPDLQAGMKSGKYTARGLTEKYIERIEAIDRKGPKLNSVIELNPGALEMAEALDRERQEKGMRGLLHGIPVLIKDNIDTADKMATTAGSLALIGAKPPIDAYLVQQLRKAGAVILGKTNLSEWANIRSHRSTSGWSGRGGLTKNPYALDRNTSGSSSGSAVAVSANLCSVAVGTETDGSIVSPSSVNGLVGIKPTVGLISRSGIIPISHTQDTAGPIARSVQDAAVLLGALVGIDPEDKATGASLGNSLTNYTQFLDASSLGGARIGVVRNYFGFHPQVDRVIEEALAVLSKQGAILVDGANIETIGKFEDDEFTVLLYELKAGLKAYLAHLGAGATLYSLSEIIKFNNSHSQTEMPYFGQETFLKAEATGTLADKVYLDALKKCRQLSQKQGIDAVMNKHKLDALVAPTEGAAWMTDLINGDHFLGGSSTAAAVAGYPSITVPAGFIFGLPVGISFFGHAWSEGKLISIAYAFEQATRHRAKPRFLASVDFNK